MKDLRFVDPELFKKTIRAMDKEKAKFFRFNMNRNYLYATCRYCDCRISLKKGEGNIGYSAIKFQNRHVHKISGVKSEQEKEISSFMS